MDCKAPPLGDGAKEISLNDSPQQTNRSSLIKWLLALLLIVGFVLMSAVIFLVDTRLEPVILTDPQTMKLSQVVTHADDTPGDKPSLLAERCDQANHNQSLLEERNSQLSHNLSLAAEEIQLLRRLLEDLRRNKSVSEDKLGAELGLLRALVASHHLYFPEISYRDGVMQHGRCRPGWAEHDSRCFYVSPDSRKWEYARLYCQSQGADLAVVSSTKVQTFVTDRLCQFAWTRAEFSAWIGLRDLELEGSYVWVNGDNLTLAKFWIPGKKSNTFHKGKESVRRNCVAIVPNKISCRTSFKRLYNWDEATCHVTKHYVCEAPAVARQIHGGK